MSEDSLIVTTDGSNPGGEVSEGIVSVGSLPEGGEQEFLNAETGEYDWRSHLKRLQDSKNERKEDPVQKTDSEDNVRNSLVSIGLNPDTLIKEIHETGSVSNDSFKVLLQHYQASEIIDYINKVKGVNSDLETVIQSFGGRKAVQDVLDWSNKNLSPAELKSYDVILKGENYSVGLEALFAKKKQSEETNVNSGLSLHTQVAPVNQPVFHHGQNVSSGPIGFKSQAESFEMLRNPKYASDPAYREEYLRRLAITPPSVTSGF